jgi:thiol reductant ABC exporter CydC subunit
VSAGGSARILRQVAWPARGERSRLALSVALAAGAAVAAAALLGTSGYLISRAALRPPILMLMVAIVAVRAFGLTRAVLRYAERLVSHDLALRQLTRLRARFYGTLVPLVPGELRSRSGELLSRFVADVDTIKDLYLRSAIPALVAVAMLCAATLAAWIMLPAAGLVVLLALALATALLPWLSATVAARSARRQAPARARLTSELVESIDGARELALAGRSEQRARLLQQSDERLARLGRSDAIAGAAATSAGGILSAAGVLALLLVAIPAVRSGALSGVLLAALVFLLLAAYDSILPLSGAARSLRVCATAAGRLHELTLLEPAVVDPLHPRVCGGHGHLRLQGVSFRYGAAEPWVLSAAELSIAPGEHVAMTGPSGIGKSTIAELLVRFRDPDRGRVLLDGADLRELSQGEIRRAVVLCAQDCHVFNTSVRENLLLARRGAEAGEIAGALEAVGLREWADSLPQGLDTIIGQGGELVSGGQRTRIALARALLSDARFLILDEPTAHLDPDLARRVMRGVLRACEGRGLLAITHDTSVLDGFDRILRM